MDYSHPDHVCLKQKLLYGLKGVLMHGSNDFFDFLLSTRFTISKTNVSLFIPVNCKTYEYVRVYVDDILIINNYV